MRDALAIDFCMGPVCFICMILCVCVYVDLYVSMGQFVCMSVINMYIYVHTVGELPLPSFAPAASAISLGSIAPTRNGSHANINCKSITHCKNPKLRQLTHGTNSDTSKRRGAGSVSAESRRCARALCPFLLLMVSREENLFYLFFFDSFLAGVTVKKKVKIRC